MARKSVARRRLDRWVYYPLQTVLMYLFYGIFRLLPVDAASALGGLLGRTLGPLLISGNHRALHNLALAMPELSDAERRGTVRGMWDNIGRTMGEIPHIQDLREPGRMEIVGLEHVTGADVDSRPLILVGAHTGNWELSGAWTAKHIGGLGIIYRPPNNRTADRLIHRIRVAAGLTLIRKGNEGTKAAMKILSQGGRLGMLVDQKLNRGIAVPFFGRDAMTTPALAMFALRFDCIVVPARVERLGGAHFRMTFDPALKIVPTGDRHSDIRAIMAQVNTVIEGWIRKRPEQWIWMHRRWIDSAN